jgi:hypothetical protein
VKQFKYGAAFAGYFGGCKEGIFGVFGEVNGDKYLFHRAVQFGDSHCKIADETTAAL